MASWKGSSGKGERLPPAQCCQGLREGPPVFGQSCAPLHMDSGLPVGESPGGRMSPLPLSFGENWLGRAQ